MEKAEYKEMELLCRSHETRMLNASRVPRAEIYRDEDGGILSDGREVIERWKQHFDERLNGMENEGTGDHDNGGND